MKHGNNPETAAAFVKGYEMQGSNLHTNGESIYSYSTPIANKAKDVILLKNLYYSHTTQRHKLHIRRAANRNGVQVYEVPTIFGHWYGGEPTEADHKTNFEYLREEAQEAYKKSTRARTDRTRQFWQEETQRRTETARKYRDLFGVKMEK